MDTTTVKARVYIKDMEPSEVAKAEYEELHPDLPPVLFKETFYKAGDGYIEYFETSKVVEMVCQANGKAPQIRYTINGSDHHGEFSPARGGAPRPAGDYPPQGPCVQGRQDAFADQRRGVREEGECQGPVLRPPRRARTSSRRTCSSSAIRRGPRSATLWTNRSLRSTPRCTTGSRSWVRWTTTIKARAFKRNWKDSEIVDRSHHHPARPIAPVGEAPPGRGGRGGLGNWTNWSGGSWNASEARSVARGWP